jgi:hypothetical protein
MFALLIAKVGESMLPHGKFCLPRSSSSLRNCDTGLPLGKLTLPRGCSRLPQYLEGQNLKKNDGSKKGILIRLGAFNKLENNHYETK